MAQHDHDPLLPGCDETLNTEDYDKWFSETWGDQASQRSWFPKVSAHRDSPTEDMSGGIPAALTVEKSVISHTQHVSTDAGCPPFAQTSMQYGGPEGRDRNPLQQDMGILVPVPSSWSSLGPNSSSAYQLPEEVVYRNHTPDQSETTIYSTDHPSANPSTHETIGSQPSNQSLSITPTSSQSLQCATKFDLYQDKREKHLWYAISTLPSGSQEVRDGLEIKFLPPSKQGQTHRCSTVHNAVRNRVSRIRFEWSFLVSEMSLDESWQPPAPFLLADDNLITSLLTKRALNVISRRLKAILTPSHRECRYKKARTKWISQNRQTWKHEISDLNSLMEVLKLALQVRDMLHYPAGTRLASYARLDEARIAALLVNKRDVLLHQAET